MSVGLKRNIKSNRGSIQKTVLKGMLRLRAENLINFIYSNAKTKDKHTKKMLIMSVEEIIRDGKYAQKEIEKVLKN